MRTLFYTTLLSLFVLSFTSCLKKRGSQVNDTPVAVYDEPRLEEQEMRKTETEESDYLETGKILESGDLSAIKSFAQLKKYSVIVASMSQQSSSDALSRFFDRDGIGYTVVRNSAGFYCFVVYTSDSEEDAIKARGAFLVKNTVGKSKKEIWDSYNIHLIDTFIYEKKN